jgi:alpha-N-arabinofuranosidase
MGPLLSRGRHLPCRRCFLRRAAAGAASLASALLPRPLRAGDAAPARVLLDPARTRADLDRRLFGSFLEHIGRAIYGGIFEPGSKQADPRGFRKDVLEEVRTLGVPIVRYPGGNFVSGYNWLDGIGPVKDRPRVLDRAWNSIETNQFGTDEFVAWCRAAGAEPMLAVNLGTGTAEGAAALVEYCNVEKGTRYSDLRRRHGAEAPHGVKFWCLGNEMDGPWQIGHTTAAEYGRKAADAARQMRAVDRTIRLVACGSSGPSLPTYLEWDRQVLQECYAEVDALSLHRYFRKAGEAARDSETFLAQNLGMERQVREAAAVCDLVRGRLRARKELWLSFDEWNVWYRATGGDGRRQVAPHLIEEVYNLEDALLVGGLLNALLRQAARVRVACLAQLVNVIAPLLTNAETVLRQTIYYPYAWALGHARGKVLDLSVESPGYEAGDLGAVPYLDAAGTLDARSGQTCLLLLNRDLVREREVEVTWREGAPGRVLVYRTLTGNDLKASNSFAQPRRVAPAELEPPRPGGTMRLKLPARSYTVLQTATG